MAYLGQVNYLLASLSLAGQVFIVLALVMLIFFRRRQNKMLVWFRAKALVLSFIVALVATLSSLYYSEIAGFVPCELCWFQRIFMYPQVILLGLAYLKKDFKIINYSLPLILIGALFSIYHNYIYYTAQPSNGFCSITAPCTQVYIVGFNYISIPLLAIISFLMIGLLLLFAKTGKTETVV